MQRQTTNIMAKQLDRTIDDRLSAIRRDINALEILVGKIDEQKFEDLEQRVALFILNGHAERIHRALVDLSQKSDWNVKSTSEDKDILEKISTQLIETSERIKKKLPENESKEGESAVVVAGAGPIGYYSAISLLKHSDKHDCNIVLVADKYANFPTRGGTINPWVLGDYAISLGLGNHLKVDINAKHLYLQKLLDYVTLREQGDYSIKHLDMLGHATYLALGGKIISGTIDWNKIQQDHHKNDGFATVNIMPDNKKEDDCTQIQEVRCIVNAMGANAAYPNNIKRKELQSDEDKQVSRNHCAQVNVSLSPPLFEKLIQLRDCNYSKGDLSFVPFFMHGYFLRPYNEMPSEPQKGIVYVKDWNKNNEIEYTVKTPSGKIVTDKISKDKFNIVGGLPDIFSFQFTSAILKITSEKGHTNYGKKDKNGNYKVQLFYNLTKNESDLLDKLVEDRFKISSDRGLDDIQKTELRVTLKMQLFLEFLSDKANFSWVIDDSNVMILRDKIKMGKQLCREFKIPNPSAPPQEIVEISGTKTIATWVGAAALPTIINGRFVPTGVKHAEAVIDHLIANNFKMSKLDQSPAMKIYQAWIKEVETFIDYENKNSKDISGEMSNYFNKVVNLANKSESPTPAESLSVFKLTK